MREFVSGRMHGVKLTEIWQNVIQEKELKEPEQPLSQEEKWGKN